jgi:hypothetical protein
MIVILFLVSCSKEKDDKFIASAELNGEILIHFDAQFRKGDDGLFTLFLSKDSELGPEHRLNFYNFEKEVGRSNILPTSTGQEQNLPHANFSSLKYQRDVLLDLHQSIAYKDVDSWIEIDNIGYRRIEGRFQVVMKNALPSEVENPFYPYLRDTLIFREGKFIARRFY